MPTDKARNQRIRAARITILFLVALMFLVLAGFAKLYTQNQQIRRAQRELAAQQQQTCVSRQQSRTETDTRILIRSGRRSNTRPPRPRVHEEHQPREGSGRTGSPAGTWPTPPP